MTKGTAAFSNESGCPAAVNAPSVQQPGSVEALRFPLSSRAKPRDLRFSGPLLEMFFESGGPAVLNKQARCLAVTSAGLYGFTIRAPLGPAITATEARPRKSPCSTTPVMLLMV